MTKQYPAEIYDHLQRVQDFWNRVHSGESVEGMSPLDDNDWRQEFCLDKKLTRFVPSGLNDGRYYQLSPDGEAALRPAVRSPSNKKRGKQSASVNERMAAMLQADASLLDWTALQWANKLGCTDAAVKQTQTWTKTIRTARAMQKAEKVKPTDRRRGRQGKPSPR
jgi:hypothetical protein